MIKIFREKYEQLVEMAIINPRKCKNASIQIEIEQRNEGSIPHVHVYLGGHRDKRNCAYVRLDKAEYSKHHDPKIKRKRDIILNNKEKEDFVRIMSDFWENEFIKSKYTDEVKPATGYQKAVSIWIDTYGETVSFNYDEDGFPIMPDYTKL
jgi:hypothetical protein